MREPWSFKKKAAALAVSAALVVVIGPPLRDVNEQQWCSGAKRVSETALTRCLADQKAIRSGPLGIFHSPPGAD